MRLQQLIAQQKRLLGLTQADLVARSAAAGFPISRAMWHRWMNEQWSNIPPTETIRGIAMTLKVSPREVIGAAAESVGLSTGALDQDPHTLAMLAMVDDRSPAQRELLTQVIRSVTAVLDAPTTPADDTAPAAPTGHGGAETGGS